MVLRNRYAVANFAFGINQYETDVLFELAGPGDIRRISHVFAAHFG